MRRFRLGSGDPVNDAIRQMDAAQAAKNADRKRAEQWHRERDAAQAKIAAAHRQRKHDEVHVAVDYGAWQRWWYADVLATLERFRRWIDNNGIPPNWTTPSHGEAWILREKIESVEYTTARWQEFDSARICSQTSSSKIPMHIAVIPIGNLVQGYSGHTSSSNGGDTVHACSRLIEDLRVLGRPRAALKTVQWGIASWVKNTGIPWS